VDDLEIPYLRKPTQLFIVKTGAKTLKRTTGKKDSRTYNTYKACYSLSTRYIKLKVYVNCGVINLFLKKQENKNVVSKVQQPSTEGV